MISLVIPVHAVAGYLGACLDSVLGQAGGTPIEVIAVDDASPDRCGELLDERAKADKRLTVLHLASAGGPGNARNEGLAAATGRYVWFVDGDDVLPDGAIAAAASRLGATDPDVLLIDYAEIYPDGSTRPSTGGPLLSQAPAGLFSLAESPKLINLTMTGWSKLFRRDFLSALGEPFRPGIHEDIPVTCAALFAGRLAVLNRVCYLYRRSRPGSFMATTSERHWAVFDAYEEVLARLDKLAEAGDPVATRGVRNAVFERAMAHYAAILQTTGPGLGPVGRPGLVPRGDRRRFFARMHADYVRYRPPGYRPPPGPLGVKLRLIERGAYWPYEVLEPANKLRVAARRSLAASRPGIRVSLSRPDLEGLSILFAGFGGRPAGNVTPVRAVFTVLVGGLAMRHVTGILLALALSAALFFGAGWGVDKFAVLQAGHGTSGLTPWTSLHNVLPLAALLGTGLLLGLLLAVRRVSALAAGLPGLALLGWSGMVLLRGHRALTYVPMAGSHEAAGFIAMLTSGALALAGAALIIPLFMPSRWRAIATEVEDYDNELTATSALGMVP